MKESDYQAKLKKKITERIPGSIILKNDASNYQAIPDLSIFAPNGRWAMLEVKTSSKAKKQPNQELVVESLNKKGFAAIIFPENEKEVLDAMERSLKTSRDS